MSKVINIISHLNFNKLKFRPHFTFKDKVRDSDRYNPDATQHLFKRCCPKEDSVRVNRAPIWKSQKFIVFFLLLFMFIAAVTSMAGDSAIRDEVPHITAGYSYFKTGDYRLNPEHPPLIKDLAAVPLLFLNPKLPQNHFQKPINDQWSEGSEFLYKTPGNNADLMLFLGRLPVVLLSILLGYFVYLWAKELYGKKAGLFALTLYAFDANIIAHSRFITTDLGIAATVFINLYFLWKFLKEPSKKGFLLVTVTFAIAFLTKFSAPILVITYAIVALYFVIRPRPFKKGSLLFTRFFNAGFFRRLFGFLLTFFIAGLGALFIVWIVYAFQTINMPKEVFIKSMEAGLDNGPIKDLLLKIAGIPFMRPLGHYMLGFFMVQQHATGGHASFLLGQVSNGWWYYYIVAFFVKTAVPTMIFIALSPIFWMAQKKRKHKAKVILLVPVFIFIFFALTTKINLGIRYLLPIFPLLYVFISFIAEQVSLKDLKLFFSRKINFNTVFSVIFFALIVWGIISSVKTYPYYLTYFNELIGGPKNGMRYITDSNLDWGQDMKRLAKYVERNNIDKIRVEYFGGADYPEYYLGSRYISWNVERAPEKGYYAISATYFQQSRAQNKYEWLKDKKPLTTIGHSILIFKY